MSHDRRAQRRQLLQAMHAFVQAWTRQPMREAMAACYGDTWAELRLTVVMKNGDQDKHVLTPLPKSQVG